MAVWEFPDGQHRQSLISELEQKIRIECGLEDAKLTDEEALLIQIRTGYRLAKGDDRIAAIGGERLLHRVARYAVMGGFFAADQHHRATRNRSRMTAEDAVGGPTPYSLAGCARELLREHPDLRSQELWPHFLAKLDELDEGPCDSGGLWKARRVHLSEGRSITYRQFQDAIKAARRKDRCQRMQG